MGFICCCVLPCHVCGLSIQPHNTTQQPTACECIVEVEIRYHDLHQYLAQCDAIHFAMRRPKHTVNFTIADNRSRSKCAVHNEIEICFDVDSIAGILLHPAISLIDAIQIVEVFCLSQTKLECLKTFVWAKP